MSSIRLPTDPTAGSLPGRNSDPTDPGPGSVGSELRPGNEPAVGSVGNRIDDMHQRMVPHQCMAVRPVDLAPDSRPNRNRMTDLMPDHMIVILSHTENRECIAIDA